MSRRFDALTFHSSSVSCTRLCHGTGCGTFRGHMASIRLQRGEQVTSLLRGAGFNDAQSLSEQLQRVAKANGTTVEKLAQAQPGALVQLPSDVMERLPAGRRLDLHGERATSVWQPVAAASSAPFETVDSVRPLGPVVSSDATAPTPTINYNQNVAIRNRGVVKPASLEALQRQIASSDTIRVIGRGHSFNETLQSDGLHIDMRALNRSQLSDDGKSVWVEAGCVMEDLKARLADSGLALNTAPMHQGVTVGGSLATASHGTGLRTGSFSDEVLEMEVLDANGVLHRITDPEELQVARAGLGVAGVVYRVKLGVRPNDPMVFKQTAVDPMTLRKTFTDVARQHERADAFYYPGDVRSGQPNGALLRTFDTATPENSVGVKPMSPLVNYVKEHVIGTVVADQMLKTGVAIAQHTGKLGDWVNDTISTISVKGQGNDTFTLPTSEAAHYFPGHVAVVTMEYSMPLENNEAVWNAIDQTIADTGYVPEMAFYFRTLKGSENTLMSPSRGRDSIIMESYQFHTKYGADPEQMSRAERAEMRKAAAFMQALEQKLVALGGRSHPAKIFHVDQMSLYPPGTQQKFEAFRSKMDPTGKFMNEWAKGTLGLEKPRALPEAITPSVTSPVAPSSARLEVVDAALATQLGAAWRDFQRMQGPAGAAVIEQEADAQAERLEGLGKRLSAKKEALELFIGQGTHSQARVAEARQALEVVDGTLHDVALMAKPLGQRGVGATRAVAASLFGDVAVVVDQGHGLELWSRANPNSTQKVADLGSGRRLGTDLLQAGRGFQPALLGSLPLDQATLASSPNFKHVATALGTAGASAADLFSADLTLTTRPEAGPALAAQHARNLKEAPAGAESLSVMSFNVALLDVKPFEKQLGAGGLISRTLERALALESPDITDRRRVLPEAILSQGKDVVLLQEVWNAEDVERFQRAAEKWGYVALTTPRGEHSDGLMTLIKKSQLDETKTIEQRAVTYEQQDAKEQVVGGVKRGIQEVRYPHPTLGWVRLANTHAQAYPEHHANRLAQMRTLGLLMRDGDPNDVVIGGGDLNAGPYYASDTHVKKNGDEVPDWYKNGLSYWALLHYSGGFDAALTGRSETEATADVTAAHQAPTKPGWPHTATALNEHYAAQYDERAARLDHLMLGGQRQVRVASSHVEFTERRADVGGPLSDHYGVSVNLQVARPPKTQQA